MAFVSDTASGYSVMVEDDGHVAYAYLQDTVGEFLADVWLYNRAETPVEPEWHDRTKMPFLNPAPYVRTDVVLTCMEEPSDISVHWEALEQDMIRAWVYLHKKLVGVLVPGAKPGWSLLAARDGPLARRFTEELLS